MLSGGSACDAATCFTNNGCSAASCPTSRRCSMLVMVLQNSPASLKGLLSRWLIEVRSGVFLGNPSSRIRDVLWDRTVLHPRNRGYAIQIWSDQGPQGFSYRTWGEGG